MATAGVRGPRAGTCRARGAPYDCRAPLASAVVLDRSGGPGMERRLPSDAKLVTRYETDPLSGGTGMNVNFVTFVAAEA